MSASTTAFPSHKLHRGGGVATAAAPHRATSSEPTGKRSYQLRQYANSPRREDPYAPDRGEPRSPVAVLLELEVVSALLKKNGSASKL